jgi:hypothetical protein
MTVLHLLDSLHQLTWELLQRGHYGM